MTRYEVGGYRVDLMTVVRVGLAKTASGDRLEDGANYTDHVERNPDTVHLEAVISDDPTGDLVAVRALERENSSATDYRPTAYARAMFRALLDQPDPIDVVTAHESFTRYFLIGVDYAEGYRSLEVSLDLLQARTVGLLREYVTLPKRAPRARGQVNLGIDPISGLVAGLRRGAAETLAELQGEPLQIYDDAGRPTATYDVTSQSWVTRQGNVVDPYSPGERWKLSRGSRDAGTGQILGDTGLPISRSPAEQGRIDLLRQGNNASGFLSTPGGKLTRALNPAWRGV